MVTPAPSEFDAQKLVVDAFWEIMQLYPIKVLMEPAHNKLIGQELKIQMEKIVQSAYQAGRKEENEGCAKIAEDNACSCEPGCDHEASKVKRAIASVIRSRLGGEEGQVKKI